MRFAFRLALAVGVAVPQESGAAHITNISARVAGDGNITDIGTRDVGVADLTDIGSSLVDAADLTTNGTRVAGAAELTDTGTGSEGVASISDHGTSAANAANVADDETKAAGAAHITDHGSEAADAASDTDLGTVVGAADSTYERTSLVGAANLEDKGTLVASAADVTDNGTVAVGVENTTDHGTVVTGAADVVENHTKDAGDGNVVNTSEIVLGSRNMTNAINGTKVRLITDAVETEDTLSSDSGVKVQTGALLRDRYVLFDRIAEVYGPPSDYPKPLRRQHVVNPSSLGSGGFGDMWKAFDSRSHKEVAIKFLYDRDKSQHVNWANANDRQHHDLDDLMQECSLVKHMMNFADRHEGSSRVCRCYEEHVTDAMRTTRPVFLVFELCGTDLSTVLNRMGKKKATNVARARKWVRQILEGLLFAQNVTPPLMHHDLKPATLAVDGDDLKIIDWAAAMKSKENAQYERPAFTSAYCPPEIADAQFSHPQAPIAFAMPLHSYDVYSLGLVYAQMLCPRLEHKSWIKGQHSGYHEKIDVNRIWEWMGSCPELLQDLKINEDVRLIARMASRDPESRPSPAELLQSRPLAQSSGPDFVESVSAEDHRALYKVGQEVLVKARVAGVTYADGDYIYDLAGHFGEPLAEGIAEHYIMGKGY